MMSVVASASIEGVEIAMKVFTTATLSFLPVNSYFFED